jgi:hypothetical protein
MIDENVMYAELRPMLLDKFIPADDGIRKVTNAEQMRLIIAGVKEKQAELKEQGRLDKFPFGLKIIYCTPRSIPVKMMQEEMKQCIELKKEFPKLICGKPSNARSLRLLPLTLHRLRSCRSRRSTEPHRLLQSGIRCISKDLQSLGP